MPTIRQLVMKNRKLESQKRRNKFTIIILIFICIGLILQIHHINNQNKKLNTEIINLDKQITQKDKVITDLSLIIQEVDNNARQVMNVNKTYVDELTELRNRSELYDKYSYAIINGTTRTELTYDEIKLGETLMKEKGYDPNLLFGTIMVESGGNPNAVNSSSDATGYGQFINSTARFVWTDLLNNDNYYSEIRKDGKSNIQMMVAYYDYLYDIHGDTFGVIKSYSGNSTNSGAYSYLSRINNYTLKVGATVK